MSSAIRSYRQLTSSFSPGEYWWGGLSVDGYRMPYGEATELRRNLYANNQGNQASPDLDFV
jgi:hypothetical protein